MRTCTVAVLVVFAATRLAKAADELPHGEGEAMAEEGDNEQQQIHPVFISSNPDVDGPVYEVQSNDFLAVGDWGSLNLNSDDIQVNVAQGMRNVAKELGSIGFVWGLGDNFYTDGVTDADDPLFESDWASIYGGDDALGVANWWLILGNHDYHTNPHAEIEFSQKNPRWNMPDRYYKKRFDFNAPNMKKRVTLDAVFIDTEPIATLTKSSSPKMREEVEEQWVWINSTLAECDADYVVVVGHHPVYSVGEHGDTPNLLPLGGLLSHYEVDFYLCGHDHMQEHLMRDGVSYLVNGSGGKVHKIKAEKPTNSLKLYQTSTEGFMRFNIDHERIFANFVGTDGHDMYTTTLRRKRAAIKHLGANIAFPGSNGGEPYVPNGWIYSNPSTKGSSGLASALYGALLFVVGMSAGGLCILVFMRRRMSKKWLANKGWIPLSTRDEAEEVASAA
eukprot:Clim_evm16s8 gene=Clim_evmTU16s8